MDLYRKQIDDYLDDISDGLLIGNPFNIASLLAAIASSFGGMVCYLSETGSEYSEVNKRLTKTRIQLEQYRGTFKQLTKIFNNRPKQKEQLFSDESNNNEIQVNESIELYIDLIKHCNEVISFLATVKDFGSKDYYSEIATAAILIKASVQISNLLVTKKIKYIKIEELKTNYKRRTSTLSIDITKTADSIFNSITREISS
ncbi:formiminotransferase-cyclodeaminase [bacterium BMS3Abin04]|nr:formiminotransferase-cyclodeaminase [bacterium BMS3Abin04]